MLRGAPRVFSARGKHSVLPERSPCSAVLPEHSLCSAVLSERSLCSAGRPVPAGSGRYAGQNAFFKLPSAWSAL